MTNLILKFIFGTILFLGANYIQIKVYDNFVSINYLTVQILMPFSDILIFLSGMIIGSCYNNLYKILNGK